MLGQATARLQSAPRRWMLRLWGAADIHTRQKWTALWPHLARLPHDGVRLLDAGCGDGRWSLELAERRPGWQITGIDISAGDIAAAQRARDALGTPNATFACADFLHYTPAEPFDVVLAVASTHYLVEAGHGAELFHRVGDWLAPGGRLLMFGPRRRDEVPRLAQLPPPFRLRDEFSRATLDTLCREGGLDVELLVPSIGTLGTYAKQVSLRAGGSRAMSLVTYPLQICLTSFDRVEQAPDADGPSSAWVLVARRRG
jgi:SAM-dependent methyltransferase